MYLLWTDYLKYFVLYQPSNQISLAPVYWYFAAWEIWGKLITCHLRVTLCYYLNHPMQMSIPKLCKWYETSNLIGRKGHTRIYHIVYAWHKINRHVKHDGYFLRFHTPQHVCKSEPLRDLMLIRLSSLVVQEE